MNDVFHEQIVIKKKSTNDKLKQIGLIFLGVIVGLITYFIPVINTMFLLFFILAIWGAVYLSRNFNIEYEYAVTNYYLDIDKIVAQRKRTRLVSLDIRKIDYFIPFSDSMYKSQENDKSIIQTIDCTSNSNNKENVHAIIANIDGKKSRVLIEPNKEISDAINKFIQKKSYQVYR
ncbi:DUF6106 family protein [Caldicellulosiruptoraceae bacterium PP1]